MEKTVGNCHGFRGVIFLRHAASPVLRRDFPLDCIFVRADVFGFYGEGRRGGGRFGAKRNCGGFGEATQPYLASWEGGYGRCAVPDRRSIVSRRASPTTSTHASRGIGIRTIFAIRPGHASFPSQRGEGGERLGGGGRGRGLTAGSKRSVPPARGCRARTSQPSPMPRRRPHSSPTCSTRVTGAWRARTCTT